MSPPCRALTPVTWPDPLRQARFLDWLERIAPRHAIDTGSLSLASADASFRRYLRVAGAQTTLIVMDAPPPHEDVRGFVKLAAALAQAGLNAPQVLEADEQAGFLLLSDLGDRLYLQALQDAAPSEADRLMRQALSALVRWQQQLAVAGLPRCDEAQLAGELALFPQWCVQAEFGVQWTAAQQQAWLGVCQQLIASALAQPVVAVHADWMPRNLMVGPDGPGILDFQDAFAGPITYDLASLLRDAFISWDEAREIDWAVRWWQEARQAGLPLGPGMENDFGEFWRALEWMGLQRHLRVMGIFCRLKHRDGKPAYVQDLPRFFGYALKVALRYRPLAPLAKLLEPLSGQQVRSGFTF